MFDVEMGSDCSFDRTAAHLLDAEIRPSKNTENETALGQNNDARTMSVTNERTLLRKACLLAMKDKASW